jgi:hypothetical protein
VEAVYAVEEVCAAIKIISLSKQAARSLEFAAQASKNILLG